MSRHPSSALNAALAVALMCVPWRASAQDNYEIQVYPSETVPSGATMFELHSNYTLQGRREALGSGQYATNHALHETLEITHGLSNWSELGFYLFSARPQGRNIEFVGTHVRPRIRVPESWRWPVGVSVSQEIGFVRSRFASDSWTYELRPIVDKQIGRWYASVNPVFGKSLRGPNAARAFDVASNVDVGFDLTKKINVAVEYYGSTGTIARIDPLAEQQHQLFGAINLDLGPMWECNLGYGTALTAAGDKRIVKMIFGRRVGTMAR